MVLAIREGLVRKVFPNDIVKVEEHVDIPLRDPEPDAHVDLKAVLDRVSTPPATSAYLTRERRSRR